MSSSITNKTYKKLSLLVSNAGFSYAEMDTLSQRIVSYKNVVFPASESTVSIEDLYKNALEENQISKSNYDEISVVHNNNLSCLVPTPLFDENELGFYLQYNVKVFDTDFFAFDANETYQINTVYVPNVAINNVLIDQFGAFGYKHSHTVLVSKLLDVSKNIDAKKMYVHFQANQFELIVVQNQNLLLFNSFEYTTPEDFIYYILFTAEQLFLNPENMLVELLGAITEESAYYKIAYKYIRNISMFDMEAFQSKNAFSELENRSHFILFNL